MRGKYVVLTSVLLSGIVAGAPPNPVPAPIDPQQEAPKGLAILPWKPAEPGALPSGPLRRVDVPIAPLDPEVFEREIQLLSEEAKP